MNKYLMTMKPIDTFFFGQEGKYRKKKDKGKTKEEADYFQVSAYFPQQTTVLGMLRYFILQENNQIPIQSKKIAIDLIGEKSFNITDEELKFGYINSLSPIFIRKGKENYIQNPLDLVLRKEDKCKTDSETVVKKLEHSNDEKMKTNIPHQENKMLTFKDYNEKEGLNNFLINMKKEDDYLVYTKDEDEKKYIFEKVEKVGINKSETDKAYYKQVTYKFKESDISFACIVELEMKLEKDRKYKAFLGAERSLFEIQFTELKNDFESLIKLKESNKLKVLLLSDTYIENNTSNYLFSISKTKPFRFLKSEVENTKSYAKFNESGGIKRSDRFNLFERGSVFYFKNNEQLDDFTANLQKGKKGKNFYKIGYNYFKTF